VKLLAFSNLSFLSPGPLHPIPSLWRTRHPFHGRLTSYMACKRCEQQVTFFRLFFSYSILNN